MAWHVPIASGAEGFIGFIVVLVIIVSQLVRAGKSISSAAGKPQRPAERGHAPEDELRDFLKRLSQGADQPPPLLPRQPAPPPLPHRTARTTASSRPGAARGRSQPAPQPAPHRAQKVLPQPVPPAPAVIRAAPAPEPETVPARAEPMRVTTPAAVASKAASRRRAGIVTVLKDREAARSAILLREILGPPLSLRRQSTHAFVG